MKVLVDTHAFFWWLKVDRKLSQAALEILEDDGNDVLVSAVVAWELSTKARIGKWPGGAAAANDLEMFVRDNGLHALPISISHARLAGSMPGAHRDPFDRILAAQSNLEDAVLVTADPIFRSFNVSTVW